MLKVMWLTNDTRINNTDTASGKERLRHAIVSPVKPVSGGQTSR